MEARASHPGLHITCMVPVAVAVVQVRFIRAGTSEHNIGQKAHLCFILAPMRRHNQIGRLIRPAPKGVHCRRVQVITQPDRELMDGPRCWVVPMGSILNGIKAPCAPVHVASKCHHTVRHTAEGHVGEVVPVRKAGAGHCGSRLLDNDQGCKS